MSTATDILRDKIRKLLKNDLASLGLDPDSVYLNGVNNLEERLVIDSRSLTEEALDKRLHRNEYPNGVSYIEISTAGFFSKPYSFDEAHRVNDLSPSNLSAMVTHCLRIAE